MARIKKAVPGWGRPPVKVNVTLTGKELAKIADGFWIADPGNTDPWVLIALASV